MGPAAREPFSANRVGWRVVVTGTAMDVYLIPFREARYELYCEVAEQAVSDTEAGSAGIFKRSRRRFRELLAAEQEQRQARQAARSAEQIKRGMARRLRDRVLRWVAEAIAEQRLLWHLRRQHEATLVYPDDLDGTQAMAITRGALQRDFERHRLWLIIDGLAALVLGPLLFFVPGPNLIAYYFLFRTVGHFLSMRGARHGLGRVVWQSSGSSALADLRQTIALEPRQRARRIRDIASRLRLEHFATFFERTAIRST